MCVLCEQFFENWQNTLKSFFLLLLLLFRHLQFVQINLYILVVWAAERERLIIELENERE